MGSNPTPSASLGPPNSVHAEAREVLRHLGRELDGLGDILVAKDGEVAPGYLEAQGAAYMKGEEIAISVDVGVGHETATVWTCDLTKDYIAINADYRS